MDLLARIEVDGVCLGGIRLSGVLRPKQVASVGAQTKTRAWAFRLGSSCASGVSHARCKWLPATCSPYHTSIRARLSTPDRSLLPVTSNILPTNTPLRGYTNLGNFCYNYRLMNKGLIYPDECYAIRRAIYEVYDEIGSGFREAMGFVIPFVKIRVPRSRHSCLGALPEADRLARRNGARRRPRAYRPLRRDAAHRARSAVRQRSRVFVVAR